VGGLRLITTGPVLSRPRIYWKYRSASNAQMDRAGRRSSLSDWPEHLGDIARWMRRYSEGKREWISLMHPVLLAAETGVTEILTVDVAIFTLSLPRGKALLCCNSLVMSVVHEHPRDGCSL